MATAKKNSKKMTELETALLEANVDPIEVVLEINGKKVTVSINRHLDIDSRKLIVNAAEMLYFTNDTYDKARGDFLMENLIFSAYTGITFNDDSSAFDKFKGSDEYSTIIENFPYEVHYLWDEIYDEVDYLKTIHAVPVETREMHNFAGQIFEKVPFVLNKIEEVLDSTNKILNEDGKSKLSDIINAIDQMNQKDEAKIAKAVLEYQHSKENKSNDDDDVIRIAKK